MAKKKTGRTAADILAETVNTDGSSKRGNSGSGGSTRTAADVMADAGMANNSNLDYDRYLNSVVNQKIDEMYSSRYANDTQLQGMLTDYRAANDAFYSDASTRYSNGYGTKYVGDSGTYLDSVNNGRQNISQQHEAIRNYVIQNYGEDVYTKWLKGELDNNANTNASIYRTARADNDYWTQFADENEWNTWNTYNQGVANGTIIPNVNPYENITSNADFAERSGDESVGKWGETSTARLLRMFGNDVWDKNGISFDASIIPEAERDEFWQTARYILNTQGEEAVREYVKYMQPYYQQGFGERVYNGITGMWDTSNSGQFAQKVDSALETAMESGVAFAGGARNWGQGLQGLMTNETLNTGNGLQMATQLASEDSGQLKKWWLGAAENIGNNFIPQLAGLLGAGDWGAAALMGLSAAGSAKQEALNNGASVTQANVYGLANGISETLLGKLFNAIPGAGGYLSGEALKKFVPAATGTLMNSITRAAAQLGISNLSEVIEEVTQNHLEQVMKWLILDEDLTWKDILWMPQEDLDTIMITILSTSANNVAAMGKGHFTNYSGSNDLIQQAQTYGIDTAAFEANSRNGQLNQNQASGLLENIAEKERAGRQTAATEALDGVKNGDKLGDIISRIGIDEKGNLDYENLTKDEERIFKRAYDNKDTHDAVSAAVSQAFGNVTEERRAWNNSRVKNFTETVDGKEVSRSVSSLVLSDNGTIKARVQTGESFETTNYDALPSTVQKNIRQAEQTLGNAEAAVAAYNAYDGKTDYDTYLGQAQTVATLAAAGQSMDNSYITAAKTRIGEQAVNAIYTAGKNFGEKQSAVVGNTKAVGTKTNGTFDIVREDVKVGDNTFHAIDEQKLRSDFGERGWRSYNRTKYAMKTLSKALKLDIRLYDSRNSQGQTTGAQGAYINGTRTIYLDIFAYDQDGKLDLANSAVTTVLSHELTHFMQQNDAQTYAELKAFVFDKLSQSENFSEMLSTALNSPAAQASGDTLGYAMDEMVAHACENMLTDSKSVAEMIREAPTLAGKVKAWLNGVLDLIRGAAITSPTAESSWLANYAKELQAIWDKGIANAVKAGMTEPMVQPVVAAVAEATAASETYSTEMAQALEDNGTCVVDNAVLGVEEIADDAFVGTATEITNEEAEQFKADDNEYLELAKEPEKNKSKLAEIVKKAAEAAGYVLESHHGTALEGNGKAPFTVFNKGSSGFYTASVRQTAENFAIDASGKTGYVFDLYAKFNNPFVVDANNANFYEIATPDEMRKNGYGNDATTATDSIAWWAKEHGYDGIIVKNVVEGDGTLTDDYVAFSSEQLKSADPVTYDDNGNAVPISQRFNEKKVDIRFSSREDYSKTKVTQPAKTKAEAISKLREMVTKPTVERNEDGEMLVAKSADGHTLVFSEATWREGGRDATEQALRDNGHTPAEIAGVIGQMEAQLNALKQIGDMLANTKGYTKLKANLAMNIAYTNYARKQVGKELTKAKTLSSLVNNGDYPLNFDLSLSCKKRVAYGAVMNRLLADKVLDSVTYDAEAIAKVNEILRDNGFETACLGCFVESRRLQFQEWAETVVNEWNREVDKFSKDAPSWEFYKGSDFNIAKEDLDALDREWMSDRDNKKLNDKGVAKMGSGSSVAKMNAYLKAHPASRKKLTTADLLTADGLKNLKATEPGIFSIAKSRYGAAAPKIVQDFNPYSSEIASLSYGFVKEVINESVPGKKSYVEAAKAKLGAGKTPAQYEDEAIHQYVKDIGGLRIQSFSDFMIENTFDMLQILADTAARKFHMHGYTKEQMCMRLFGMSGQKWNGSWIAHNEIEQGMRFALQNDPEYQLLTKDEDKRAYAKKYAGLMPVGSGGIKVTVDGMDFEILMDDVELNQRTNGKSFIQSMGMRDNLAIILDPRYSPNCGNITIGVSDLQIRAMLNNPLFRMVIPYHKSGMSKIYADMLGIGSYNDYTDQQNTTINKATLDITDKAALTQKGELRSDAKVDTSFPFNKYVQELGSAKAAADYYLAWCADKTQHPVTYKGKVVGYTELSPKFSTGTYDFTQEENYYKLLEDFNTYDTVAEISQGKKVPAQQNAVKFTIPSADNRLTAQQMEEYKQRLRDTGVFSEEQVEKYAKLADMTFDELCQKELEGRAKYEAVQNEKFEGTVQQIKDALGEWKKSSPEERQAKRDYKNIEKDLEAERKKLEALDGLTDAQKARLTEVKAQLALVKFINKVNNMSDKKRTPELEEQAAEKKEQLRERMAAQTAEKVQFSYRGEHSKLKNDNLDVAKAMESEGRDSETIRLATGWFKGYDGKWRYEMDDSKATLKLGIGKVELRNLALEHMIETQNMREELDKKYASWNQLSDDYIAGKMTREEYNAALKKSNAEATALEKKIKTAEALTRKIDNNTLTLADIFDHPKLFKAYPDLKNVKVRLEYQNTLHGAWGLTDSRGISIAVDRSETEIRSTLMHEIQHMIQFREHFAIGSSPQYWAKWGAADAPNVKALQAELDTLEDKLHNFLEWNGNEDDRPDNAAIMYAYYKRNLRTDKAKGATANIKYDTEQIARIEGLAEQYGYTDLLKQYLDTAQELEVATAEAKNNVDAFGLYQRTAGEVESRDVQARLDMSAKERKKTRPDIDRKDVVFATVRYAERLQEEKNKNPENLTEPEFRSLLEAIHNGYLTKGTYIPVSTNTPEIVRRALKYIAKEILHLTDATEIASRGLQRPMAMEVGKAQQSMGDRNVKYGNGYGHEMTPDEIVDVLHKMYHPSKMIYEGGEHNHLALVVKYQHIENGFSEERTAIVSVDLKPDVNPKHNYNGYPSGNYNIVVTVFRASINERGYEFLQRKYPKVYRDDFEDLDDFDKEKYEVDRLEKTSGNKRIDYNKINGEDFKPTGSIVPSEQSDSPFAKIIASEETESQEKSERDNEYLELAKDPWGNRAELTKAVSEAATEWGAVSNPYSKDMVFYHGTKGRFFQFENRTGQNHDGFARLGSGHYFAATKRAAEFWAKQAKGDNTGKVMPVYIKGDKLLNAYDKPSADIIVALPNGIKADSIMQIATDLSAAGIDSSEFFSKLGYDGIVSDKQSGKAYDRDNYEVVIFKPENIKSAEAVTYDDNGNVIPLSERFNSDTADIRYSERDNVRSDAEILNEAFEDSAKTEPERKALNMYHQQVEKHRAAEQAYKDALEVQRKEKAASGMATPETRKLVTETHRAERREFKVLQGMITNNASLRKVINAERVIDSKRLTNEMKAQRAEYNAKYKELNGIIRGLESERRADVKTAYEAGVKAGIFEQKVYSAEQLAKQKEALTKKANERLNALRTQRDAKLARQAEYYRDMQRRQRERRAEGTIRNKIKKMHGELVRMIEHPSENKYIPKELLEPTVTILEALVSDKWQAAEKLKELSELQMRDAMSKLEENDELTNAEKKRLEQLLKSKEFLEGRRDAFAREAEHLAAVYEKVTKNGTSAAYDENIADMLKSLPEVFSENIYDMNEAQLARVYNVLTALRKTIRDATKLKLRNEELELNEVARGLLGEMKGARRSKNNFFTKTWWDSVRPQAVFERFGGYKKNSMWSKLYNLLNDGQLKVTQLTMELSIPFGRLLNNQKQIADFTGRTWNNKTDTTKLVDIGLHDADGNAILVSKEIAASIYMDTMNEQNARHMALGGKIIPNLDEYYKGTKDGGFGQHESHAVGFSLELSQAQRELAQIKEELKTATAEEAEQIEERIKAIEQQLKEAEANIDDINEQIDAYITEVRSKCEELFNRKGNEYIWDWIKATRKLFDEDSKTALNEVTNEVYGFDRAEVENYFPIRTDPSFRTASFESIVRDASLENAGFMKERINGANPTLALGITDVVRTQIDMTARYCGMMPAVREFTKVYGKTAEGYTTSVQKELSKVMGKYGADYINKLMSNISGSRHAESNPINSLLGALRGNLARATLTLSPRVALSQAASLPTASAVLGHKAIAYAFNPSVKVDENEIAKYTPLYWYRMQGYSTTELGDIKNSNKPLDRLWKKANFLTGWIQAMDGFATRRLWAASKYYVENTLKMTEQKNGEEYWTKVAEMYNKTIEETQPNYTTMQRPELLRNPDGLAKSLTMFSTQRLQNLSIVVDAAERYAKYNSDLKNKANGITEADVAEAKDKLASAVSSQMVQAAAIVGIKFITDMLMSNMKKYRDDDDDEVTAEAVGSALLDMYLDTIVGNFFMGSTMYGFFKALIGKGSWYDVSINGVDSINSIASDLVSFAQYAEGDNVKGGTLFKKFTNIVIDTSVLFGMPTNNAMKLGNAVRYLFTDLINGDLFTWEASSNPSKKQNTVRLLTSLESGDSERVAELVKTLGGEEEAYSQLKSYLQADYKSRHPNYTEEEVIRYLTSYCGYSASEADDMVAYWDLVKENPTYSKLITQSAYSKYRHGVEQTGVSVEDYAGVKKAADTNGNGKVTQEELGTYLLQLERAGAITRSQASAIWKGYQSNSTTAYTDWLAKH